ncbi:MAG: peptidoglycan DD-metalloendopeptidase family protein [Gammaproteobacteria bacterium]|nr:peptidoglycan DD-metalloendopeptidase family protein [Gammaproteobacteria bacterium]
MNRISSTHIASALIVGAVLSAGCAMPSRAPVLDRGEPVSRAPIPPSDKYTVRPKDSLYAIAWKFNLDYRDLARRNGIEPPYTIHPGQELVLYGVEGRPEAVASAPAPSGSTAGRSKPAEHTAPSRPQPSAKPAPRPKSATVAVPIPKPVERAVPEPKAPKAVPKPRPPARSAPPVQPARAGWRWPVNAQPARGFGRGNNGLDYVIPSGQKVVAAAAGQIVYKGAGLGGYRHLVLVRHTDSVMSAYSVNVAPAVAEGTSIASGGKICDIGSGSPAMRRLHFEIRRSGTPVDPVKIIGRR